LGAISLTQPVSSNGFVFDAIAENATKDTIIGQVAATDRDGDNLTYSITTGNSSGAFGIDPNTGKITVVDSSRIDFETNDSHTLTVQATDTNLSATTSVSFGVTDVNEAPSFTSNAVTTVTAGNLYTYNVTTFDPDTGDTRNINSDSLPNWLTLTDNKDGTATLNGTPTGDDVGNNSIELVVKDAAGLSDTQTFAIAVESTDITTGGGNDNPGTDGGDDTPTTGGGNDTPTTDNGGNDTPTTDNGDDNPTTDNGGNDTPTTDNGDDNPTTDNGGNDNPTTDNGDDNPTTDNGDDNPTTDNGGNDNPTTDDDNTTDNVMIIPRRITEVMIIPRRITEVMIIPRRITEVMIIPRRITEVMIIPRRITEVMIIPRRITEVMIIPRRITEVMIIPRRITEVMIIPRRITEVMIIPQTQLRLSLEQIVQGMVILLSMIQRHLSRRSLSKTRHPIFKFKRVLKEQMQPMPLPLPVQQKPLG
jgi:hypothetical protein